MVSRDISRQNIALDPTIMKYYKPLREVNEKQNQYMASYVSVFFFENLKWKLISLLKRIKEIHLTNQHYQFVLIL